MIPVTIEAEPNIPAMDAYSGSTHLKYLKQQRFYITYFVFLKLSAFEGSITLHMQEYILTWGNTSLPKMKGSLQ